MPSESGVDPPAVDGRTPEALLARIEALAPAYVDEWDPTNDAVGWTLARRFAEMAGVVVDRVDRVPGKHRRGFYDALGFDRAPPQAARLPLTVRPVDDLTENVQVPAGTRATAPGADGGPERTFEVAPGEAFEATPARLERLYSVRPDDDAVFEHPAALDAAGGAESRLFDGENLQSHVLSVGHLDHLNLGGGATVRVVWTPSASIADLGHLVWEYYEEREGDAPDGHWHAFAGGSGWTVPAVGGTVTDLRVPAGEDREFTETSVGGVTARWFRCRVDPDAPDAVRSRLLGLGVGDLALLVGAGERSGGAAGTGPASERGERLLEAARDGKEEASRSLVWKRAGRTVEDERLTPAEVRTRVAEARMWERSGSGGGTDAGAERPDALDPDHLLANGTPLPAPESDDPAFPFGATPAGGDTFAVASDEAFTKRGTAVELGVSATGEVETYVISGIGTTSTPVAVDPDVVWQYWNGSTWALLDVRPVTPDGEDLETGSGGWGDAVLRLQADGLLRFTVPADLAPTTVAGHEGHWVRVQALEGEFGEVTYTRTGPDTKQTWTVDVDADTPTLEGLTVAYGAGPLGATNPATTDVRAVLEAAGGDESGEGEGASAAVRPTHLVAENALSEAVHAGRIAPSAALRPFAPLPDGTQAAYFGANAPLDGGPVHLFVSPTDRAFPESFAPDVRWEYWDGTDWRPADVRDGSEGLTARGIVRLTFPSPTAARTLFGRPGHWLRARVAGRQFDPGAGTGEGGTGTGATSGTDAGAARGDPCCPPPCEAASRLATDPPIGAPTEAPPTLRLVALNTGWVRDVHTVTEAALGTSDGTPGWTAAAPETPLVDATLWVDELAALSDAERRRLATDRPDGVRAVAPDGSTVPPEEAAAERSLGAFWVRWEEVPDLLASAATDRHYTLDRLGGRVTFGDGVTGAVPPRGSAVEATYGAGGGRGGNVAAGAVAELKNALPLVDSVSNPEAGDGGADPETTEAIVARAPLELRDRDRAVAPADFERLALAASRRVARARCLPRMDEAGEAGLGWVTVVVVPESDAPRPTPSAELRARVEDELADHAPLTLFAPANRLVVRGPSYVSVSVEADLAAAAGERTSALEARAADTVSAYLHPLTGDAGEGWPLGSLPCVSDMLALLEGVEGVDHVDSASLTYVGDAGGDPVVAGEGDEAPTVEPDALVHSGTHALTARPAPTFGVGADAESSSSSSAHAGDL